MRNIGNGGDDLATKSTVKAEKVIEVGERSVARIAKDAKIIAESNVIGMFYKNPESIGEYERINLNDFTLDESKVRFSIAKALFKEGKLSLDPLTVGFYLEQHPKLKNKFAEYGGYEAIGTMIKYLNYDYLDSYVRDMMKWNAVLKMFEMGFPITEQDVKEYKDLPIEDIYNKYEVMLSDVFINIDTTVKSHNVADGLYKIIDECDRGVNIGLPLHNASYLNDITGGNMLGNITILGALSGTGKTTITFELIFPSMIEYDEKVVMIINEQDEDKLRKEMLVWVANNIFEGNFNKKRLRQGSFTPEEMKLLNDSAAWLEEKKEKKNIMIIPLQRYTVETVKKIINKYSALGVKYFVLDTFKASTDAKTDAVWLAMMIDMQKLHDTIKAKSKNVHLWATLQLKKDKIAMRHLTNDHIGMSKNIIDVASTVVLMRGVRDDEKKGGSHELKVFRMDGKNKTTKVHVELDPNKNYSIMFITKNREGETNQFQIVAESDLGKNRYRDIGLTSVPEDF